MHRIFGQEQSNASNANSRLGFLRERRCLAPLAMNGDDFDDTLVTRSLSYYKIPKQLLKLSVLKLDGSQFDVHVAKNAKVEELKQTIEELFTSSPKEPEDKISWSQVWGHFCLCYEGRKLINDKASIESFGIKDGNQIQFIRHMSINCLSPRRKSKNHSGTCKRDSTLSRESNAYEESGQTNSDDTNEDDNQEQFKHSSYEDQEEIPLPEFKLANFLRGWLSYSRLWGTSKKVSEGRNPPSRFARHFLGGTPRMIRL
ncbi:uncharacterized protein LOC120011468 [Tripterygium wilfordii]|uniref:uncharacterized protein LOC120011468 n=1 Tax=Tripterygium wilfordii TaxID=458696 RepID=UPI0018F84810|nr:uncharacterized protein LOC120011468 [Tripterygium wilfordii]